MMRHLVILVSLFSYVTCAFEWGYTEEAKTLSEKPCMSNCVKRKCVVNWKMAEEACKPTGVPAPIYSTIWNTRCLSNCGTFGYWSEWCVTTEEGLWSHCNSRVRGGVDGQGVRATTDRTVGGAVCAGPLSHCLKHRDTSYHWCTTDEKNNWDYCIPAAVPRIPMLTADFRIGPDSYLRKDCFPLNFNDVSQYASKVPENYLEKITKVLQEDYTARVKVIRDPLSFVSSYKVTVVDMPKRVSVPVAIQLSLVQEKLRGDVDLAKLIRKHLSEMKISQNAEIEFKNKTNKLDFKKLTPVFETPNWSKLEHYIQERGFYNVGLLIVIFYSDYEDPVPQAIGVALQNLCRGVVLFNGEPPASLRILHP